MKKDYEKRLDKMIQMIFRESDILGMSLKDMSRDSGVSYNTVCNLNSYKTRRPHLRTIIKLAWAVGLDLRLVEASVEKKVA